MEKIFIVVLCGILAGASIGRAQKPEKDADDLTSPTPDLSAKSNLWADTSPGKQIAFGVADLAFVGAANFVDDPEFKEARRKYTVQFNKEQRKRMALDVAHKNITQQETVLQELQANQAGLNRELKLQADLIKTKTNILEKTRHILTSGEKESQLANTKNRLVELHTKAIKEHHGKFESHDDFYSALSSSENAEIQALKDDNNAIRDMPDVNREQKAELVKVAESDLTTAQHARDTTLKNMQNIQQRIAEKASEIEKLRPQVTTLENEWRIEEQASNLAKSEMTIVAKQKGFRRIGFKAIRWGGNVIFGLDFGARIVYYFIAQQDPGYFPFGRVLQRVF